MTERNNKIVLGILILLVVVVLYKYQDFNPVFLERQNYSEEQKNKWESAIPDNFGRLIRTGFDFNSKPAKALYQGEETITVTYTYQKNLANTEERKILFTYEGDEVVPSLPVSFMAKDDSEFRTRPEFSFTESVCAVQGSALIKIYDYEMALGDTFDELSGGDTVNKLELLELRSNPIHLDCSKRGSEYPDLFIL